MPHHRGSLAGAACGLLRDPAVHCAGERSDSVRVDFHRDFLPVRVAVVVQVLLRVRLPGRHDRVIIESCVSIVGTYILLNAENHHWRWTSFLSGASIGVYLFLYCVYFYCCKTQMNGFVQAAYFFGESVRMGRQSQL